jgi:hypothetical protein
LPNQARTSSPDGRAGAGRSQTGGAGAASKELGVAARLRSRRIVSLDADGFTAGDDISVNQPGATY